MFDNAGAPYESITVTCDEAERDYRPGGKASENSSSDITFDPFSIYVNSIFFPDLIADNPKPGHDCGKKYDPKKLRLSCKLSKMINYQHCQSEH
jgi:hypothetical protein